MPSAPHPQSAYRGAMSSPPVSPPADPAGRRAAVVVAGHRGDSGTVRAHIDDEDPTVRSSAISALVRLGELGDADLLAALDDSGTARRAIELSAHHGSGATTIDDRLRAFVAGADTDLAEVASWALGERWQERGDEPGSEAVLGAVEWAARCHDDALVREAAVAALGAIGATGSIPVIIDAMNDKATVRRRAVIALAPFDGPEVEAALVSALGDRDWQVRQAAEDLSAAGPPDDDPAGVPPTRP